MAKRSGHIDELEKNYIYKVGDGKSGYAGDTWWFNGVDFIRDENNNVIGFYVQTTGGNLSTNIRFDKVNTM